MTWFNVYIGLEEAASELRCYQAELVPGLLQTPGYTRTIIEAGSPAVGPEEVERRVNLRMARQALLTRATAPPTFSVALSEAVLRRPVGGPSVMLEQLDRLVAMSELPNVLLNVVPFTAGLHNGVFSGPFIVLPSRPTAMAQHRSRARST